MADKVDSSLDEAVEMVRKLSPLDQLRLVEQVIASLKPTFTEKRGRKKSLYGLCADLGTAPSAEEIDEVRREVWANFPREDI
jgi:hypothetical protein